MQEKDGELSDVISFSYKIQENELLSISQKRKIQEDSAKLKQEWNDVETTIEEKSRRWELNTNTPIKYGFVCGFNDIQLNLKTGYCVKSTDNHEWNIFFLVRLNEDIRNFEQEQDSKLSMWQKTCKPLSDWLDDADQLISSSEVDGSGITNIKKQKKKMEVVYSYEMKLCSCTQRQLHSNSPNRPFPRYSWLKLRLHTAINRADFVSWWMWFNG